MLPTKKMDKDTLFLRTIEDIEKRMKSQDLYEIFMISGLLRKLLTDGNPLVDQVNESRRLKIKFRINSRKPPIEEGLIFWDMHDGFDPDTGVPHLSFPVEVGRDDMLKAQIMTVNGKNCYST